MSDESHKDSGKKRTKGHNNVTGYVVQSLPQYSFGPVAVDGIWRSFAESYEEGRRLVHVHFRVYAGGSDKAGDFCATFERLQTVLAVQEVVGTFGGGNAGNKEGKGAGGYNPQVGESVLVLDRKLVKYPEKATESVIPSLVRLQFLDECLRVWVDAPDLLTTLVGSHSPVAENGELQLLSAAFGQRVDADVGDGEFVDEVVERGAEVVQEVPDSEREGGRYGFSQFDYEQLLAGLEVEIVDKAIRVFFKPGPDIRLEALQVLDGPI